MKFLLLFSLLFSFAHATLEPRLPDDDDGSAICTTCFGKIPNAHPASSLKKLDASQVQCGKRCEELLKNAKAEGMRCPHEWAPFAARKHGQSKNGDACAFYRAHGKDPTQWSKGLCATAVYHDFINTGIAVGVRGTAHEWARMLEDPLYHMKKLNLTDPAQAPRGAVLVYSSQVGKRYGHIEVAMGDEYCSDYCYPVDFMRKAPGEHGQLLGAYIPEDI